MASKRKYQAEGAARARAAKLTKRILATYVTPEPGLAGSDSECETGGCTSWAGGVNHVLSESEDDWLSSEDDMESDSDGDDILHELKGNELLASLKKQALKQIKVLKDSMSWGSLFDELTSKGWNKAKAKHSLGYNGHSSRTKRHHKKLRRDKEEQDKKTRQRYVLKT